MPADWGRTGPIRSAALLLACLLLLWRPDSASGQERIPVDRWLVSTSFPADTAGDPLQKDYLSAPGEASILPARGQTEAGADWKLLRTDSAAVAPLDGGPETGNAPVVVYAHAYIRAPEDRTVHLTWGGEACTRVVAWLNGRPLDALGRPAAGPTGEGGGIRTATVRLGLGYNTFLLEALSGECPFGVTARLEAVAGGSLQGLRVQASRPYGDTRTGPEPWVISGTAAGPDTILEWRGDRLLAAASIRLAAFAVTPIEAAEIKVRAGGREAGRRIEWLTPLEPRTVRVPFEFGRLRRAILRGEGLELDLKWPSGEARRTLTLHPSALLEAFHGPIRLRGWSAGRGPAPAARPDSLPLPAAEGETVIGSWKVPGWLAGLPLELHTEGAPGRYRLDSRPVSGPVVPLCGDCRKGQTFHLAVEASGAWSRFPTVLVAEPLLSAEERRDGTLAIERLGLLNEDGSQRYREIGGGGVKAGPDASGRSDDG